MRVCEKRGVYLKRKRYGKKVCIIEGPGDHPLCLAQDMKKECVCGQRGVCLTRESVWK